MSIVIYNIQENAILLSLDMWYDVMEYSWVMIHLLKVKLYRYQLATFLYSLVCY